MPKPIKQSKRPTDVNQLARFLVDASTREAHAPTVPTKEQISLLMSKMGRKGDKIGGKRRYAMLVKLYGSDPREDETRYSPAQCIGCRSVVISGNPKPKYISASFVERQNSSVRTAMRRYTRLSNGFSRKIEDHPAAIALNYFAYNFVKIHRTLRVSPAMAAGVTDHLWDVSDLVALWESEEAKRAP